MSEAAIKYMTDNFNLDEAIARTILNEYKKAYDQEVRRFGTRAGGTPTPTPQPPTAQERPPARKVDPFWYLTNTWQVLEPTIAWPLGVYQMAKMGMAAGAGLPVKAALPRRLGGMTARELWASARNPTVAQRFQTWIAQPRAQRAFSFNRPSTTPPPGTSPGGRTGGIFGGPRVLPASAWMPAAGILASVLSPKAAPTGKEWCFGGFHTPKECAELAKTGGAL